MIDSQIAGPSVLVTAGVHGDEYEPMLAVPGLASQLVKKIKRGKLILVPVASESAFEGRSRFGADGLDLARTCPGKPNGTVTEISANAISELIIRADYYIDLHTGGLVFEIFPLAGYMLHESPGILEKQQMMAEAFNLPVIWGTDPYPQGRTLSVARDANVPAIYVEYGGGQLVRNEIVQAYYNGCLNILAKLEMLDATEPQKATKYWVEDYRIDQGHLQSKTPAPIDGIFIPSVKLGEIVKEGQEWGKIKNPCNQKEASIKCPNSGIVLFIRVAPYVKKGEALGGILPISEPGKIVIK